MSASEKSSQADVTDEAEQLQTTPENLDQEPERPDVADELGRVLHHASVLSEDDVRTLTLARPVRRVSIVGPSDSGKTTLTSEIYAQFLKGEFAGLRFAGSDTLAGFEERLHLSRMSSGGTNADTAHTSVDDPLAYLHLKLADKALNIMDLAVSDRAGEVYRALSGRTETAAFPSELSSSDHLCFLIDGERLCDPAERSNALENPRNTLRKLIDKGVVKTHQTVEFVVTKSDWFLESADADRIEQVLQSFMSRCLRFEAQVRSIKLYKTAVRREPGSSDNVAIPFGIDSLLRHWLTPQKNQKAKPVNPTLTREYDRLIMRGPTTEKIK